MSPGGGCASGAADLLAGALGAARAVIRDGVGGRLMPGARALLEAALRLGAGRRGRLVIGSSGVEREAARSAGMVFVHVGAAPRDVFTPGLSTRAELLPLLRAARTV
ncbi:hypothetical protein ACWER6_15480 [Streptomyces sp. NPDC004009]